MAADKTVKAILDQIDGSIKKFQKSIPGIQKGMYDGIIDQLKDLSLQDGKVLNSVQNHRLVMKIKNQLERLIVSEGYKESVKDFIRTYNVLDGLHTQYFAAFNQKFTPNKTLPILKEAAIDKTLNDLLAQGLQSNVVDKVGDILLQNTTAGGSYASLTEQLRNSITTNSTGEGVLEKYTKTITTDAVNQYSAQYHDTLAQDLKFNWGRYVGSNLKTTREFCEKLTEKEWVHRSELPAVLKGEIDGHQCKTNKQGLPLGMIPGTTVDNFKIRRGGYNCGHQFFWVPDNAVPDHIKASLGKPKTPAPEKDPPATKKNSEVILSVSNTEVKKIEKKSITIPQDLLDALPDNKLRFATSTKKGAWYEPGTDKIVVGKNPGREKSKYFTETVMPHEIGHALHTKKGIITGTSVSKEFQDHFEALQEKIKGKEADIEQMLIDKHKEDRDNQNRNEQIMVMLDIIGSLSKGKYGQGHEYAYYRRFNGAEKEIFAHGMSLIKTDNEFSDITEEMAEVVKMMKEYSLKVLE